LAAGAGAAGFSAHAPADNAASVRAVRIMFFVRFMAFITSPFLVFVEQR
jgi:hypothetical protein